MITDWLEFQVLSSQIEGPLEDAVFPADPFATGVKPTTTPYQEERN